MICRKRNKMHIFLLSFILSVFLLGGCGSEESSGFSRAADDQVVCNEIYMAYITEEGKVFLIMEDNSAGEYISGAAGVRKVFGDTGWLILFLENGSFQIYSPSNRSFVTEAELDPEKYYASYPVFQFLLSATDAEDAFCIGSNFAAVLHDGSWEGSYIGSQALQWENIVKYTGINGEPDLGLRQDGTVAVNYSQGDYDAALVAEKVGQWTNVADIAEGFAYFGLLKDGTVITARPSPGLAADVTGWTDICQITAAPYVTAGLTNAGKVLVRSPYHEEMFEAQEWENIRYIQATSFYILGIDAEGNFQLTESDRRQFELSEDADYPLPSFAVD